MLKNALLVLTCSFATVACASQGISMRVPAELVQSIPEDGRSSLETKERHLEDARDAQKKAENDLRGAELDLRKAELDRETTVHRIEANNEILALAQDVEGQDRAVRAAKVGSALEVLVDADDEGIEWREEGVEYAKIDLELAKERVVLADAELEAARADAVMRSDAAGKEAVVLSEYKLQVSRQLERTSKLEEESSEQWKETEEARKKYEAIFAKVPAEASEDRAALIEARANLKKSQDAHGKCTKKVDELASSVGKCKKNLTMCEQNAAEASSGAEQ